jgi:hypothetical protein
MRRRWLKKQILCKKTNFGELAFYEVRPSGVLGIAPAGVREARGRMVRRMHQRPLSVVRSWTTSTGPVYGSKAVDLPRLAQRRTAEAAVLSLPYLRVSKHELVCQAIAHSGDALRPSLLVLRSRSATFVDVRVG